MGFDAKHSLKRDSAAEAPFDVIIVGAGLSGIDAAYRLQTECPQLRYTIIEARDAIGGTWDLFRYPGIRSDSDMVTLGFPFRPWRGELSIAGGDTIRDYIRETASEFDITRKIRFGHKATSARWSDETSRWTLCVQTGDASFDLEARFLYVAGGYYDYSEGYTPAFEGMAEFGGKVLHPQFWPADFDPTGKQIVVIGSGATAMTLVPALATRAAHVVMLQRSPTYVASRPARDAAADRIRRWLPGTLADGLVRWKNVLGGMLQYRLSRSMPSKVRSFLIDQVKAALPAGYDVGRDFSPRYDPWDQRICVVTDGDLFSAIREGRASVVTDTIARFVPEGVQVTGGRTIAADAVVVATGLKLQMLGGMSLYVGEDEVPVAGRLMYKGLMLDGIPNLAFAFGYTNASWTLKCDLSAQYFCRLLNRMDRKGHTVFKPVAPATVAAESMVNLTSGYVERAASVLPHQGDRSPWRLHQNYLLDKIDLEWKPVADDALEFSEVSHAGR